MASIENKYRIPKGAEIKPSSLGYYNFWYPHEKKLFLTKESLKVQPLSWSGGGQWSAVAVELPVAGEYESPIKVLWVRKKLLKDIASAVQIRDFLKTRGKNK